MPRMRWRPGLCPGRRWGSSRRSPSSSSRLGLHSLGAFVASILAPALRRLVSSVDPPTILPIHHWEQGRQWAKVGPVPSGKNDSRIVNKDSPTNVS